MSNKSRKQKKMAAKHAAVQPTRASEVTVIPAPQLAVEATPVPTVATVTETRKATGIQGFLNFLSDTIFGSTRSVVETETNTTPAAAPAVVEQIHA